MSERQIPERDAEHLRTSAGVQELPAALVESYWQYKRYRDPLDGSPLQTPELALIGVLSGVRKPAQPERPVSAYELLKSGRYPDGQPLTIEWRKEQAAAEFMGLVSGGRVRIRLAGQGDERILPGDKVLAIGQGA